MAGEVLARSEAFRKNNPTLEDINISRMLSQMTFAIMQSLENFVSTKVFPIVPVPDPFGEYYEWPKGEWYRSTAQPRGDVDPAAEGSFKLINQVYATVVWAIKKRTGKQTRAVARKRGLNLEMKNARYVAEQLALAREIEWMTNFFSPGVWTQSTPAVLWSAGGDVIDDVTAKMDLIQGTTGKRPNKLVLGREVWTQIMVNSTIRDRLNPTSSGNLSRQQLATMLELDEVLVAAGVRNTALEGATDAISFINGKHALLVYADPNPDIDMASAGMTFVWDDFGVTSADPAQVNVARYREDNTGADVVEGETNWDQRLTALDLGHFFNAVIA